MKPLDRVVRRIRSHHGLNNEVPGFDPANGNESARILFLFEAPGPGAVKSGIVSFENNDPSARNFKKQLGAAGILREQIAVWNTVPWYIGAVERRRIRAAARTDIDAGIKHLGPVLRAMPNLEFVVLMGAVARRAHVFLSRTTSARIVSCHHTSARVHASNPAAARENIQVLWYINRGQK